MKLSRDIYYAIIIIGILIAFSGWSWYQSCIINKQTHMITYLTDRLGFYEPHNDSLTEASDFSDTHKNNIKCFTYEKEK